MNEARKKATELAVNLVKDILPKSNNAELTKQRLDRLSDKEFEELMRKFQNGEDFLQILTRPGEEDSRLNIDNLHKVGKKYGIKFYHRVWMYNQDGSAELSNKESMILYLPIRVQQQLISKKIRTPKDNNHIDYFTGQATGKMSKGARLSYPEVNSMLAMGLTKTVEELMHFRGGSDNGMRLIEQSIISTGRVSADAIKPFSGMVGSTKMLHYYLRGMQLKSNLIYKF